MSSTLPPLALLAGGLATRLRPLTEKIPKSMIEVAGEPFISHQLRLLAGQGVREVVVCCGYLGEQIEEFVGDGARWGCSVRYSQDGVPLKGTGGAIRKALPLLGEEFFVMYGDSYLPAPFRPPYDHFVEEKKLGLMTVFPNDNQWDASNVEFSEGEVRKYDKKAVTPQMRHIDYGLGIFRRQVFDEWSNEDVFDLATVYQKLLAKRELAGYEVSQRFYEIGTPSGLSETDALLRGRSPEQRD